MIDEYKPGLERALNRILDGDQFQKVINEELQEMFEEVGSNYGVLYYIQEYARSR